MPLIPHGFPLIDCDERLLKQVIPSEDMDPSVGGADNGSSRDLSRPSFSLPLMTSNFRRFNARYV